MVLVYGLASVSGGHLNPAVSVAVGCAQKMNIPTIVLYIVAQMIGGMAGGFSSRHVNDATAPVGPSPNIQWWEAAVAEGAFTALLTCVWLSVTAKRNHPKSNPNQFYGLAIGSVVTAAGGAIGPISGALLNPAVSFGLGFWVRGSNTLLHGSHDLYWGSMYGLYQTIGGVVGAVLFYMTHPEDFMHDQRARAYVPPLPTRLISEFIGTFYVVLTFGLCVLLKPVTVPNSIEVASTPWAMGAVIMALVYALGDVSGGHFNPAVTLAALLCRKIDINLINAVLYVVVQLCAGALAALLYAGLCKGRTFPLEPRFAYTEWAAYLLEGIFTAMYCLAVLSTGYAKGIQTQLRRNYYFGLVAGLVYAAGHVACAKVSVGVLNPAIACGVGLAHKLNYGDLYYSLSYSLAECIGGAVAVMCFVVVHAEAYKPKPRGKLGPDAQYA
jgi:aquaporin Z